MMLKASTENPCPTRYSSPQMDEYHVTSIDITQSIAPPVIVSA